MSRREPEVYAARKLRRALSLPEVMLWQQLRGSKLGFKVRRQHPIGPYVVDFYVREWALNIEVDGDVHSRGNRPLRDEAREAFLTLNGHRVLHVTATDVMENLEGVLQEIAERAENPLHHVSHGPPPRAGEDFQ